MPRVYFDYALMEGASGDEEGGDPIDLCRTCWRDAIRGDLDGMVEHADDVGNGLSERNLKRVTEEAQIAIDAIRARRDDGPFPKEGDEHPSYEHEADYTCQVCGMDLGRRDE